MRFLISILLVFLAGQVPAEETANLQVTVSGVTPAKGQVIVSLFDEKKAWLKKPSLVLTENAKDSDSVDVIFSSLGVGLYAVSVFYDQDSDGELDTGVFRIPKEPVGFSNNARRKFGPAKWSQTSFRLEQDMEMTINVINVLD